MTIALTAPAESEGHAWRARRHRRGIRRVEREISPAAPVDRGGRPLGCNTPAQHDVQDAPLDRLAEGKAV